MIRHSLVKFPDQTPSVSSNEELAESLPFSKPRSVEAVPDYMSTIHHLKPRTSRLPSAKRIDTHVALLEVQKGSSVVLLNETESSCTFQSTDLVRIETDRARLAREGQLVGPIMHVQALPQPQLGYSRSSSLVINANSSGLTTESSFPTLIETKRPKNTISTGPPFILERSAGDLSVCKHTSSVLSGAIPQLKIRNTEKVRVEAIMCPDWGSVVFQIVSLKDCPVSVISLLNELENLPDDIAETVRHKYVEASSSSDQESDRASTVPFVDSNVVVATTDTPTETASVISVEDLLPIPVKPKTVVDTQRRRVPAIPVFVPPKNSTAFGSFSAILALVKLQRRVRKRYKAQREQLINDLGL
jgi:hypothetical protein